MARIVWTPQAARQLEDVLAYLSERSYTYGELLSVEIERAAGLIAEYPRIGRVVPELGRDDVREVIVDSYRMVYVIHRSSISIVAVFHGAMDIGVRLRKADLD